jgi:ribosome-binding protein aMBF1 (putative translation factor)
MKKRGAVSVTRKSYDLIKAASEARGMSQAQLVEEVVAMALDEHDRKAARASR